MVALSVSTRPVSVAPEAAAAAAVDSVVAVEEVVMAVEAVDMVVSCPLPLLFLDCFIVPFRYITYKPGCHHTPCRDVNPKLVSYVSLLALDFPYQYHAVY